jgi:aldehyde dehydrogenase (NAD+)
MFVNGEVIFPCLLKDLLTFVMPVQEAMVDATTIKKAFESLRKRTFVLRSEPVAIRKNRLSALQKWIHKNRPRIHEAMFNDFNKPSAEVDAIEIYHVLNEIKYALVNLETWAKPKKIDAPLTMLGTRSSIQYEPRGTCLIISPWNYPFSLSIGPLVSALAAGNNVIIKPSEITTHLSSLLKEMALEVFEPDVVAVIEGDADISKHLLTLPFDHIFFTGSPAIGKVVMKAAAENLTSVTLELGGKSPTIVSASANLNDAAERITVGKFVNNGQTCIAPDYILAEEKIADELIKKLIDNAKKLFSDNGNFLSSSSYCRISSAKHYSRLTTLLNDALQKGATMELGGNGDANQRFFHPVILSDVPKDSALLEEEIFGPILPIIKYKSLDEAIRFINAKPKPLALYIYSNDRSERNKILKETSAGAVCINDSGIHFLNHHLPFGGVNNSGIGKSHGYYGFLAFSNEKPVLIQKSGFTTVKLFYPPYTNRSKKIMDWFLKFF